jgi:hypothetical protein
VPRVFSSLRVKSYYHSIRVAGARRGLGGWVGETYIREACVDVSRRGRVSPERATS